MAKWLKITGKLVYDPVRADFKKVHKARTLVLELPRDELDLYYQWFLEKRYGTWHKLQRPMWGPHVTVIKGNESVDMDAWKKHAAERVEVEYSPELIERHWSFWNLEVRSPRLEEIRRELKVKFDNYRLHLTVGRNYDWQPERY